MKFVDLTDYLKIYEQVTKEVKSKLSSDIEHDINFIFRLTSAIVANIFEEVHVNGNFNKDDEWFSRRIVRQFNNIIKDKPEFVSYIIPYIDNPKYKDVFENYILKNICCKMYPSNIDASSKYRLFARVKLYVIKIVFKR